MPDPKTATVIKTIYVEPGIRWTGQHFFHWMAYLEGAEHDDTSPRDWGQTQMEAERALAVLVADDGTVENRVIPVSRDLPASALVEAGNYLNARLRGRTLQEVRDDIQRAKSEAQAELARLNAERNRKLRQDNTVSQSELDVTEALLKQAQANADAIRAVIEKKTLRAPFAGRLGIRLVNLGEQITAGKGIVSLQSLSPVFVDFSLPEQEFSRLQTGLVVRVASDAYLDQAFIGEIAAINPDLDSALRTVRVRAKFENADELLRAGMFVRVKAELPGDQSVLAIPSTAILSAPYGDSVFVVEPQVAKGVTNLVVEQKFIRTGRTKGDFVSLESGLKPGERVVTAGIFKLRKGMRVTENNALTPTPSQTPTPPNS
jgi:membrane fusion protein (multidrug efflux system)